MAYTAKNDDFIDAEQWVHQAIANKSKDTKSIWRSQVETGKFEYGRGYMMKKHAFYGGKEITNELGDWNQLIDPEFRGPTDDACQYTPQVVGYGFEQKLYTIYETTRRTETICLRDLTFKWQFENQLKMIFNNLSDITLSVWEKFLRETYVTFATKLIVAEGMPSFTVEGSMNSGGVIDNAGLRLINIKGAGFGVGNASEIGLLTQSVLDYQYMYLARQAHMGKVAEGKNAMPVFGLITSFETSTEIVENNDKFRTDRRYIDQEYLLEGYGTITGFKNWAHIHDLETPRYKLSFDGTQLERVYPFEFTPTSIGDQCHISRDYVDAAFEMSILLLKNVFKGLVPENPQNVAGASFGGCSNLGEFTWINIPDEETNLLGENGYMFARYNAAPEPLDNVDNAVVLLHRRNSCVPIDLACDGTENGVGTALDVVTATNAYTFADENLGGSQTTLPTETDEVEVVLSGSMNITVGGIASFAGTGITTQNVTIVKDYGGDSKRYRVRFDVPEADWAADIATAGDCTVTPA